MKLSIIIPVYNEKKYLPLILKKIEKVNLKNIKKEIVMVDDGSTDSTRSFLKKIKKHKVILHKKNIGKGGAIRTGIKYCTGDIILIQDADLEYNPKDYKKLITPIIKKKADVVYGSRWLTVKKSMGRVHYYYTYYLGGIILTLLANILYNAKITDEATCYKVFRSDVLKSIRLKCKRFEFCPEVTAKVRKKGHRILEVPIAYHPRGMDEGKKIRWVDGIEAVWTLIKYRFVD